MKKAVDLVIVGAGPAGLACAMQAVRQGLSVALFERDRPGGQALAANLIENYPGFAEGISGRVLMATLVGQAEAAGVVITLDEVLSVRREGELFRVQARGSELLARAVVAASGLKPKKLAVPGEDGLAGKRLFYYVDPDLVAHEKKDVLLVGGGDAALDQALSFSRKARCVTVAVRHDSPRAAPALARRVSDAGIRIMKGRKVSQLSECGERVLVDFEPNEGVLFDMVVACVGKETDFGYLDASLRGRDVPGLFYAGDCWRRKDRHISIAIGDGVAAAMKAAEYIRAGKVQRCR